jgi:hypothetical protein
MACGSRMSMLKNRRVRDFRLLSVFALLVVALAFTRVVQNKCVESKFDKYVEEDKIDQANIS